MKTKSFRRYYFLACAGVVLASVYPLTMGVRVITDMIADGVVQKENYPKYIIPYTPISLAVIVGVLLMPLCFKLLKKYALAGGAAAAAGVFFASELLFERRVVVAAEETAARLEDWQMFMCAIPPEGFGEIANEYRQKTAVEILMGEYDPAFKLHFYVISLVLIVTLLNCLYGFGRMVRDGGKTRLKALVIQSVCSLSFLGLCILACFTAFWRDGRIRVSPLSASLMTVFFVLLGVTVGVFVGSLLLNRKKPAAVWIPAAAAAATTLLMYVGEMILLGGHLYSFGEGLLFRNIPGVVLSVFDLLTVAAAGALTALIVSLIAPKKRQTE